MEENRFFGPVAKRLASVIIFTWAGCTFEMLGEYIREISALVAIFVPLELWRDPSLRQKELSDYHWQIIKYVAVVSFALFVVGVICEYVSKLAYRFKKDLEVSRGNHS